ncbi:MAG: restriction endonuclease subunit S, partial [Acidobacteriota bacterium]|nr:restriction endonuclease subunit S [Acidobacteriota bacterium]
MNADRLFALYDRVAEAPDAVGRLRRFVLDLAVRGKLAEQDPADEPTSELSELIVRNRINDLGLPGNWCRTTVGDILDFRYGKGLKVSDRADDGPVPVYGSNGIVGYTTTPLTIRRSVIVGRKGSAGALNKCNGPSWTTDVAYYVESPSFFNLDYLFFSLATLDLSDLRKGVKPGLSRADAYSKLISVPPLAEQQRIVAKVDELMALCDQLEETRTAREDTRDRLTRASLTRLVAPEIDAPTFRSHARFAVDALPALTARADQVKNLRQTILNLAVRGKLVEQDPSDEPASELLKLIAAEKARLLKARKIRKRKPTESLSPPEPAFGLPSGWTVARLSDVVVELQTGPFGSSLHKSDYKMGGTPVVNPASIRNGKIVPVGKMAVGTDTLERLANFKLRAGDIVMGRRGEMGRCAVVAE